MTQISSQPLSRRVERMTESATIKMAQMARDLSAQGINVISLSLGEPDFDTPQHIKNAAKVALDEGYTKYTPVPGLVELREAISTKFKRDNNLHFGIKQIMVSNGAKQCIANLALALLNDDDEAIILAPYWVSYYEIVQMAGGKPVIVSADIEDDFKVKPEQLKAAITDRTKFIIFSTPCNPTGSVFSQEELEGIAAVMSQYPDIIIISDEIYEYINFTGKHASIGAIESVREQTVTVNGFAKGFAMTGWRLGYMGGPEWLVEACTKIQGQFTSGAASMNQKAAVDALLKDMTPTHKMLEAFLKRRDILIELMNDIPGLRTNKPQGAFYLFPDIRYFLGKSYGSFTINNSDDLCQYILNEGHVALVAGDAFGNPNCMRISYAASEAQLREAMKRMKEVLGKLK